MIYVKKTILETGDFVIFSMRPKEKLFKKLKRNGDSIIEDGCVFTRLGLGR